MPTLIVYVTYRIVRAVGILYHQNNKPQCVKGNNRIITLEGLFLYYIVTKINYYRFYY